MTSPIQLYEKGENRPVETPIETVKPTTNGAASTEYAELQKSKLVGLVGMIGGMVFTIGAQIVAIIAPALPTNGATICGMIVGVVSLIYVYLRDNNYLQARKEIKVAQQAAIKDAITKATQEPTQANAGEVAQVKEPVTP